MRLILAFLLMTAAHSLSAQTFLDRLQSPVSGQGTVKVEESREIDRLVNGADDSQSANQKRQRPLHGRFRSMQSRLRSRLRSLSRENKRLRGNSNPVSRARKASSVLCEGEGTAAGRGARGDSNC